MGNCDSAPILDPGQILVRRCVKNTPKDVIYNSQTELDKMLTAMPFAFNDVTFWRNNGNTRRIAIKDELLAKRLIIEQDIEERKLPHMEERKLPHMEERKLPIPHMEEHHLIASNNNYPIIDLTVSQPTTMNIKPLCTQTVEKFSHDSYSIFLNKLSFFISIIVVFILFFLFLYLVYGQNLLNEFKFFSYF
jgi:hypothetical protein